MSGAARWELASRKTRRNHRQRRTGKSRMYFRGEVPGRRRRGRATTGELRQVARRFLGIATTFTTRRRWVAFPQIAPVFSTSVATWPNGVKTFFYLQATSSVMRE